MIKPDGLWNFFKSAPDAETIGRVCMKLAGREGELEEPLNKYELGFAREIINSDEWHMKAQERIVQRKRRDYLIKKSSEGSISEDESAELDELNKILSEKSSVAKTAKMTKMENVEKTANAAIRMYPSVRPSVQEELHSHTRAREGKPELRQVLNTATATMGVPEYYARWWYAEMTARGWLNTDGTAVGTHNWRPTLKAWHNREDAKHLAEIREAASAAEKREIKVSAKDWTLCEERCANCTNGKCARGIRIPPELEKRPPEECKGFLPKDQS